MLHPGSRIGGYRIVGLLGRGGMGHVFEATELALDRPVALKILGADLASDPEFRARFEREGRVQAQLDHAHVVKVHAAGEANGHLYIAMHLVRGPTLKALITSGALSPERSLRLLSQVADALDTAHAEGVTHRDVKPRNVLVGPGDHAYLADFGLTKKLSESAGFTRTGQLMGTIDYISPEQIDGHSATTASDIYSLAAILFEAVTGSVPFPRDSEPAVLFAHMSSPPPLASTVRPELPAAMDAVIAQGLAKDPADRPATAGALLAAACAALDLAALERPVVEERDGESATTGEGGGSRVLRKPFTDADFPPTMEPGSRLVPPESDPALAVPDHLPVEFDATPATTRPAAAEAGADETPATARPEPRRPARGAASPPARRRGWVLGAIAGGTILAGAVAGLVAGGQGSKAVSAPAPPLANTTGNAYLAIGFPAAWHQRAASAAGRALGFSAPLTVAGPGGATVDASLTRATTPQLLKPAALAAVEGALPAAERVRIGALPAYRYRGVRLRGVTGAIDVIAAPTTVGVVTVACTAATGDCARIADSVRLRRGRPTTLGPDAAYAGVLRQALTRLDRERVTARRALAEAGGPQRQANAALRAAAAYRSATIAVRAADPGPVEQAANVALLAALSRATDAYISLEEAAGGGHAARYAAAGSDVRASERAVRGALRDLAALGYRVQ